MMKSSEVLKNATEVTAFSNTRGGSNVNSFSLTNNTNGKRGTFSPNLFQNLGEPDKLMFLISKEDKVIIVGSKLPNCKNTYHVSNKGRGIVYNASLVEQITKELDLDFSKCTSITTRKITIEKFDDVNIAFVQF